MMRASNLNARSPRSFRVQGKLQSVVGVLCVAAFWVLSSSAVSFAQSASKSLPEGVVAMRDAIVDAAKSGEFDAMGVVIELNELPPDFGGDPAQMPDPLDRMRALATGGHDAAFLRTIVSILSLPHVQVGSVFVWPYLAERGSGTVTEAERTHLQAIVGSEHVDQVWRDGRYVGIRIEIGVDGTWHYLGRTAP